MALRAGLALALFGAFCVSAALAVCPEVTRADTAFDLKVVNSNITLPDGSKLPWGITVNGSYVGPTLRARLGSTVSVDVVNAAGAGTSIHWHGVSGVPAWADGAEGVSQRAIQPGQIFRYRFTASPAGTHWYHSHSGMQLGHGLHGPLIIEDPLDPYVEGYDGEVVLMLTDQSSANGDDMLKMLQMGKVGMQMAGSCEGGPDLSDVPFTTILTNGKGWVVDAKTGKPVGVPEVVHVRAGTQYRFRVIAATSNWDVVLSISGHVLQVIALDGVPLARPATTAGIVLSPGQRVDFLLRANAPAPARNHWINITTLAGSNSPAVLSYEGAPDPAVDPAVAIPALALGCRLGLFGNGPSSVLGPLQQVALVPHPSVPVVPKTADKVLVMYLVFSADPTMSKPSKYLGSNWKIWGLSQAVKPMQGCPALPMSSKTNKYCWTLNWVPFVPAKGNNPLLFPGVLPGQARLQTYVERLPLGAVVDVVLLNVGMMAHPMHLHGTSFWVLGSGNDAKLLSSKGKVNYAKLNLKNPPMRDTVSVPAATMDMASHASMGSMPGMTMPSAPGYTVIRFRANNPGVWPFHCHTEPHLASGMMMVFAVGSHGQWLLPGNATMCGV